jgi:pimeloyl-ACP methyl ester carboxylesterase
MRTLLSLFILLSSLGVPVSGASLVDDPLSTDPKPEHMFPPSIEELTFFSGESRLSGLLYLANGKGPHPTVILLHGFPGNEKNLDIAQVVRRAGFNVMFFHYRGAWGSEGDYCLNQLADDVAAAVSFLRSNTTRYRIDSRRLTLLGHSMGGYAALAAGQKDAGLACIGALAPANLGLIAEGVRAGEPSATDFLDYADGLFMLRNFDGKHMREDLLSVPPWQLDIRMFGPGLRGKSVLMIAGENDNVVPPESMFDPAIAAYKRDPAIKLRHYTIPGDHSFSWSRIQLTELVLDWLQDQCQ